jgi:hypothetical protein
MLKPNPQLGGIQDAIYAIVDPDSDKVISMLYRIKDLGVFIRKNRGWEYPTSEDAISLEDTIVTTIDRPKANELVEKFDSASAANDLLISNDLNEYAIEDSQ